MISLIIQTILSQNAALYDWARKKERQRIYDLLNTETKLNISEIIGVALWPPSRSVLNPLDYAILDGGRKQNRCNFPSKYWFG